MFRFKDLGTQKDLSVIELSTSKYFILCKHNYKFFFFYKINIQMITFNNIRN